MVDDMQLEEVIQEHNRTGKPISQVLQDLGILDIDNQLQILADNLVTEVVNLRDKEIPPEVVQCVPAQTARTYQCMPVALVGNVLQIALVDPLNPSLINDLGFTLGKELQLVVADPAQIEKAINKYYADSTENVADILKALGSDAVVTPVLAQPVSQSRPLRQRIVRSFIGTCFSIGEGQQRCSPRR